MPDPIGLGLHAYIQTRDILNKAVPSLLKFIDSSDMTTATTTASPSTTAKDTLRIAIGADHGGVDVKRCDPLISPREGLRGA